MLQVVDLPCARLQGRTRYAHTQAYPAHRVQCPGFCGPFSCVFCLVFRGSRCQLHPWETRPAALVCPVSFSSLPCPHTGHMTHATPVVTLHFSSLEILFIAQTPGCIFSRPPMRVNLCPRQQLTQKQRATQGRCGSFYAPCSKVIYCFKSDIEARACPLCPPSGGGFAAASKAAPGILCSCNCRTR